MRFIRLPEVMNRTGLKRSSIYSYMEEGRFPYSSKLGERSVAWVESEVQEWIEQRIRYKAWSDCNIELAKAVSIVNKEKKRRCEHCGCVKEKDNHEKGAR